MSSNEDAIEDVRVILRGEGLQQALDYLNERVPHRFTAVYELSGGVMQNVAITDKQGEVVPEHLLAVPVETSFCQFVLRDGFFRLHGLGDDRLKGHPYQGVVNSYVGVPLSRSGDDLLGTLCHFDFPALPLSDEEFEFMRQVSRILPEYIG